MRLNAGHLDHARRVADAILYEGYLLYPYHQAAQKNQVRFQFGVLMPRGYAAIDPNEASASQTECLLECPDDAEVRVLVRFLHLQRRTVQGVSPETGELHDVGTLVRRRHRVHLPGRGSRARAADDRAWCRRCWPEDSNTEFHIGPGEAAEELTDERGRVAGRLVRQWSALDGVIRLHAERVAGPYQALRLRLQVDNPTTPLAELREPGRRAAARADRRALADRRSRRHVPVHDRSRRSGRPLR